MNELVKKLEEMTAREIVLYFWIERDTGEGHVYVRGRRRTIDEGILLCGGDVKRYINYANDYNDLKNDTK